MQPYSTEAQLKRLDEIMDALPIEEQRRIIDRATQPNRFIQRERRNEQPGRYWK